MLEPATSCVRDLHPTSAPQGHLSNSLNLLNLLKVPFCLGKTPLAMLSISQLSVEFSVGNRLGFSR